MASTTEELRELLNTLREWGELAKLVAEHILDCPTCIAADSVFNGQGYCALGDKFWAAEMQAESKVIEMLPRLRAEGIDVDRYCRENNFRFLKKRQPHGGTQRSSNL